MYPSLETITPEVSTNPHEKIFDDSRLDINSSRLVRISPFDSNAKRHTSFASS